MFRRPCLASARLSEELRHLARLGDLRLERHEELQAEREILRDRKVACVKTGAAPLVVTGALLVVTGALLVVTRSY